MRNIRLIGKIKEILKGNVMTTNTIYDKLQDVKAKIKGKREKPWKYTPSKGTVKNVLSSYPKFKRVNTEDPALWTYIEEE